MASRKTVILTGASSGIGTIAAEQLGSSGWDVAVVGRNPDRTRAVADKIGGTAFVADYDRLDDVRELGAALLDRYETIDVLANNAGGLVGAHTVSSDGHERTFQHNVLAPFLLTDLLMDRLLVSNARVVNTASIANRLGRVILTDLDLERSLALGGWRAYATAKLETILVTRELARRTALTAWSFHPGSVRTSFGLGTRGSRLAMRFAAVTQISAEAGAVPLFQLISNPAIDAPSGTYFDGLKPNGAVAAQANDPLLAAELWDAISGVLGLRVER